MKAWSGHRIMVTSSFFQAMAEQTSIQQRFLSVRAFLASVDLLLASENLAQQHVEEHRNIPQSFLMALEFGGDSGDNR